MPGGSWDRDAWRRWIGDRLRRKSWNAADFARALDVPNGTVSRWVTGTRRPSSESCEAIADVFGVPVDLVLTLAGRRPADEDLSDPTVQLIERIRGARLSAQRIRELESYVDLWEQWDREDQEAARPVAFVDPSQGGRPKAGQREPAPGDET